MQDNIPRRSFLLAWLGGLLASWLGRSQTQAAPTIPPANRLCVLSEGDAMPRWEATYQYDASGRLLWCNENGRVTTFTYDGANGE